MGGDEDDVAGNELDVMSASPSSGESEDVGFVDPRSVQGAPDDADVPRVARFGESTGHGESVGEPHAPSIVDDRWRSHLAEDSDTFSLSWWHVEVVAGMDEHVVPPVAFDGAGEADWEGRTIANEASSSEVSHYDGLDVLHLSEEAADLTDEISEARSRSQWDDAWLGYGAEYGGSMAVGFGHREVDSDDAVESSKGRFEAAFGLGQGEPTDFDITGKWDVDQPQSIHCQPVILGRLCRYRRHTYDVTWHELHWERGIVVEPGGLD